MVDTEAGEDTMVGFMEDTQVGEDTMVDSMVAMVDSMADFLLALAQDFGLDITGEIIRIIGGVR